MKVKTDAVLNLRIKKVQAELHDIEREALADVVVAIHKDVVEHAPPPPKFGTTYVSTRDNKRSIQFEVGPGGEVAKGDLEGAVFSTSGYGGYLDQGTVLMAARPYFKPALDRNQAKLPAGIKTKITRMRRWA